MLTDVWLNGIHLDEHTWSDACNFFLSSHRVIEFYRKQRDAMISSAEKWLKGLWWWWWEGGQNTVKYFCEQEPALDIFLHLCPSAFWWKIEFNVNNFGLQGNATRLSLNIVSKGFLNEVVMISKRKAANHMPPIITNVRADTSILLNIKVFILYLRYLYIHILTIHGIHSHKNNVLLHLLLSYTCALLYCGLVVAPLVILYILAFYLLVIL